MRITIVILVASLTACNAATPVVMKHPDTEQFVTCDGGSSGDFGGAVADQHSINSCVEQHEKVGFVPVDDPRANVKPILPAIY